MIKFTEVLLNKGRSMNGGWSCKQIACLGEDMTRSGWKWRILKRSYPEQTIQRFLDLKDRHLLPDLPMTENYQLPAKPKKRIKVFEKRKPLRKRRVGSANDYLTKQFLFATDGI